MGDSKVVVAPELQDKCTHPTWLEEPGGDPGQQVV